MEYQEPSSKANTSPLEASSQNRIQMASQSASSSLEFQTKRGYPSLKSFQQAPQSSQS